MARFSLVLLLVAVVLVSMMPNSLGARRPSRSAAGQDADFLIPPPNSDESHAKGKVFVAAYKDYIKSLGDHPDVGEHHKMGKDKVDAWFEAGSRK